VKKGVDYYYRQKEQMFECSSCGTICNRITEWNRHIKTKKHIVNTNGENGNMETQFSPIYNCSCGRIYKDRTGLWKHKKKCSVTDLQLVNVDMADKQPELTLSDTTENHVVNLISKTQDDLKNIMLELVRNSSDFQKQMLEMCQTMQSTVINCTNHNNNSIHNNSHNKTFNLQFFLNEQCKDAMNITDFVKSLNLQMEDLESLGELGYVEGMTNIFAKRLKDIDIYKRPIHCSDAKREIIHIKHENKWHKEEPGNPIFRSAVKMVVGGNFRLLAQWTELHPESSQYNSRWNDVYNKLVKQTSGGHGDYETNNNTIMRRLTKLVVIEK